MNDFWNNISRYPRFFISSVAGLILVILAPFKNLLKIKKFQFIVPVVLVLFFFGFIQNFSQYDWIIEFFNFRVFALFLI